MSDTADLLSTYKLNRNQVNDKALNLVTSQELSLFNHLRNISAYDFFVALKQTTKLFGKTVTVEHCMYLTVLTEYISCAYCNELLYDTFNKNYSPKFITVFFERLQREWNDLFKNINYGAFPEQVLKYTLSILEQASSRFRDSSPYQKMFKDIAIVGHHFYNRYYICIRDEKAAQDLPRQNEVNYERIQPDVKTKEIPTSKEAVVKKKKKTSDIIKYMISVEKEKPLELDAENIENLKLDFEKVKSPQKETVTCSKMDSVKKPVNAFEILMKNSGKRKSVSQ